MQCIRSIVSNIAREKIYFNLAQAQIIHIEYESTMVLILLKNNQQYYINPKLLLTLKAINLWESNI